MPLIEEVMTADVLVTAPDETVMNAAKSMKARNAGSIVVVDKGKPVGIVTEKDMLRKIVAEGLSPTGTRVRDIMSSQLITAGPEDPIKNAAKLMTQNGIRRLPIVKSGKLVGIITAADLFALDPHELL